MFFLSGELAPAVLHVIMNTMPNAPESAPAKPHKLTPAQKIMLRVIANGTIPGDLGRHTAIASLRRHGYLDGFGRLTELGQKAARALPPR